MLHFLPTCLCLRPSLCPKGPSPMCTCQGLLLSGARMPCMQRAPDHPTWSLQHGARGCTLTTWQFPGAGSNLFNFLHKNLRSRRLTLVPGGCVLSPRPFEWKKRWPQESATACPSSLCSSREKCTFLCKLEFSCPVLNHSFPW